MIPDHTYPYFHKGGVNYYVGRPECTLCKQSPAKLIFVVVEEVRTSAQRAPHPELTHYCLDHITAGLSSHIHIHHRFYAVVVPAIPLGAHPMWFQLEGGVPDGHNLLTPMHGCKIIDRGSPARRSPQLSFGQARVGKQLKDLSSEQLSQGAILAVQQLMRGGIPRR